MDPDGQVISYLASKQLDQPKIDTLLERIVSFKATAHKVAKDVGFDTSREAFVKGSNSILITTDIQEHTLIIYFEMHQLKVEFFDCEHYLSTLDDFIASLFQLLTKNDKDDSS